MQKFMIIATLAIFLGDKPALAFNDPSAGPLTIVESPAIEKCWKKHGKAWVAACAPVLPREGASSQAIEEAHILRMTHFFGPDRERATAERNALYEMEPTASAVFAVARFELAVGLSSSSVDRIEFGKELLDKALKLDPNSANILASIGWYYDLKENTPKAIEYYNKAISLDAKNTLAHKQLGVLSYRAEDYDEAIQHFNVTIGELPDNFSVRCLRADVYSAKTEYNNALNDLQLCVDYDQGDPFNQIKLAKTQARLGKFEESVRSYNLLIDSSLLAGVEQFKAELLMHRAVNYLGLGQTNNAAADFATAATLGNKRLVLKLQLFLRRNGLDVAITGNADQTMISSLEKCAVSDECMLKLPGAI